MYCLMLKGDVDMVKVEEIEHFMKLLQPGEAKYCIKKCAMRLTESIPCEETMRKLRKYTINHIKEIDELPVGDFGRTEYAKLRNLICSRLTLCNAC